MRPPRVSLHDFVDSVQTGLDASRRRLQVSADLLDVVTRARGIAPEVVPRAWVQAARAQPPTPAQMPAAPQHGAMAEFLGDVARGLDRRLDEPRGVAPTPTPTRARPRWLLPLLVAAAAVLLALGLSWSRELALADDAPRRDEAAGDLATEPAPQPVTPPTPATLPATLPTPAATPAATPQPIAAAPNRHSRPQLTPAAPPSLETLEREAQQRWAAGDLEGARDRFEQIVSRGGKTKIAELALGDLITIAMRSRDTSRLRGAWSRYVDRFPRGRYADDASAGLCRTDRAADRPACWQAYLAAFPAGAHRSEAREAAARAGAP
ncbi:MAG: hypothetical protein U0168_09785 [Nannocystaceae bacterium]